MCNIEVTTIWKIEHVVICPHCIVVHLFMHCNGYPSIQASSVITIPMVVKYTDGFSCCLLHPVAHYICTSVEFYPMYGYITFWRVLESVYYTIPNFCFNLTISQNETPLFCVVFPNLCHCREYMDISWGCGWFLATLFVVTNLIGQLGAVAMVLTRCNNFMGHKIST